MTGFLGRELIEKLELEIRTTVDPSLWFGYSLYKRDTSPAELPPATVNSAAGTLPIPKPA